MNRELEALIVAYERVSAARDKEAEQALQAAKPSALPPKA
jgi:hypothetical protein